MFIIDFIEAFIARNGPLAYWLALFVIAGFLVIFGKALYLLLRRRKIQIRGFTWKAFRYEIVFSIINLVVTAFLLGGLTSQLTGHGFISFRQGPVEWWVIALEYALYFVAFDTYFYWFHRLMHKEPIYTWVHKIHHHSTSPNPLTTLSVSPFESLINGGFVPLFTAALTLHESTMLLIGPTNIIMGLYVHSGFEFMPRWWNKTWFTRWFITATFHDQHHHYFRGNYGGYTILWDWICGTIRPHYWSDFDKIKARGADTDRVATEPEPG